MDMYTGKVSCSVFYACPLYKTKTHQNGLESFIVQLLVSSPVNFRTFQAQSSIRCELKHTRLYKEGELGDTAGFYTKHQQHVITQWLHAWCHLPWQLQPQLPWHGNNLTCRRLVRRHVPSKTCCLEKTWKWIITCLSCTEIIGITVSDGNRPKSCAFLSYTQAPTQSRGEKESCHCIVRTGQITAQNDREGRTCNLLQHVTLSRELTVGSNVVPAKQNCALCRNISRCVCTCGSNNRWSVNGIHPFSGTLRKLR